MKFEKISKYSAIATLFVALPWTLAANTALAANIEEVRVWRAPDHTRLVFDLSESVGYELFTLANPDRVVIDIAKSSLRGDLSQLNFDDSPIIGLRSAIRDDDTLRMVIDLAATVEPKSFTLPPNSELGNRLVIDLFDQLPANRSAGNNSVASTPRLEPRRSEEKRNIVVAISAGHGGEDPGGIGYDGRLKEKNVTPTSAG